MVSLPLPLEASERQLLVAILSRTVVLQEKVDQMAQGFTDLQTAVDAISGEGGELTQMRDAVLAAIAALQGHVTTLQQSADALQAQFDAAGMTAGAEAQTLQQTKATLDAVEQSLNDAANAVNNPPAPPAPTP